MKKILEMMLQDVLTSIYQPFGFVIVLSVLSMFFYLYAQEHSYKEALKNWKAEFVKSSDFRKTFFLVFYVAMMLFKTLMNQNLWINPINGILDGWTIYNSNGELSTQCIQSLLLFLPFMILLFWAKGDKLCKEITAKTVFWQSLKIGILLAFVIEAARLLLRIGSVRIADFVYYVVGGVIGGMIYYLVYRWRHKVEV